MTQDKANVLKAARNQAQYLNHLRSAARHDRNNALYAGRIRREELRMKPLEKAAMDDMPPKLYEFCMSYYIYGASLTETARIIDRSERQCERYKALIERR